MLRNVTTFKTGTLAQFSGS